MSEALTIDTASLDKAMVVREPRELAATDERGVFPPVNWEELDRQAALISTCPGLAPQFNDPANCRFVAYQALRWGTDPVMTAAKTYFTPRKGGGLAVGYEAQLIHALIEGDPGILEPLELTYGYSEPTKKSANFRFLKVSGKLRGASRPSVLTTPTVGQIKVKNSALWFSDPDQQLAYYGVRAWARRYRPSRILGIYSRDEVELMRDVTPPPSRPMFEELEAPVAIFDGIPPGPDDGKAHARQEPDAPPEPGDNAPPDLEELKLWAAAERDRIVLLEPLGVFGAAAEKMVADKRFKRLIAYDQAYAKAIDRTFLGRAEELKG